MAHNWRLIDKSCVGFEGGTTKAHEVFPGSVSYDKPGAVSDHQTLTLPIPLPDNPGRADSGRCSKICPIPAE